MKRENSKKGEQTLFMAFLLSAPGPVVTGISAATGGSTTQIADCIRRSAELAATVVAWLIYQRLKGSEEQATELRARLERTANTAVAAAMICSGVALLIVGLLRYVHGRAGGNAISGLVIALLGFVTNAWFWRRYRVILRESYDAVIAAQQRLYRAKTFVDLCVTVALTAVVVAPLHPATRIIDELGSVIVAVYLLYNGIKALAKNNDPEVSLEK